MPVCTWTLFLKIGAHSCYHRAFRCMEYRPRIPHCNFDLANSLYGNCCISKTISARRSAEVSKSSQRNPLRFPFAWKGRKSTLSSSFIAFSEREPFLRGFLCGKCGKFLPQRCIWVSSQCAKSFIRFRRLVAIWPAGQFWRLLKICSLAMVHHGATRISSIVKTTRY